jgi:alpha-tubulin suppressor-like RCC1 family protein
MLGLAFALTGCDPGAFVCADSDDCGAAGRCEADGSCSFEDATCELGRRYGRYAGSVSEQCVGEGTSDPYRTVAFALGSDHSCSLDDTGRVRCWGRNDDGALGDGTRADRAAPRLVRGLPPVTRLAAGELHTCAIDDAGAVWCWGGGDRGQLGDGASADRNEPGMVSGLSGVVAIAAGEYHTCAVVAEDESAGRVYCWGAGKNGQLGTGETKDRSLPASVAIVDVESIVADGDDTCARRRGGAVSCWGENENGQLGVGDKNDRDEPLEVSWLSAATLAELGGDHACGIDRSGGVACAGRNDFGQLGDGSKEDRALPSGVAGLAGVIQVAGGEWFTCARALDGVRCWGRNRAGELGTGAGDDRDRPEQAVSLPAGIQVSQVDAGEQHACALDTEGQLWCWGSDEFGQLGDGAGGGDQPVVQVTPASP